MIFLKNIMFHLLKCKTAKFNDVPKYTLMVSLSVTSSKWKEIGVTLLIQGTR